MLSCALSPRRLSPQEEARIAANRAAALAKKKAKIEGGHGSLISMHESTPEAAARKSILEGRNFFGGLAAPSKDLTIEQMERIAMNRAAALDKKARFNYRAEEAHRYEPCSRSQSVNRLDKDGQVCLTREENMQQEKENTPSRENMQEERARPEGPLRQSGDLTQWQKRRIDENRAAAVARKAARRQILLAPTEASESREEWSLRSEDIPTLFARSRYEVIDKAGMMKTDDKNIVPDLPILGDSDSDFEVLLKAAASLDGQGISDAKRR